MSTTKKIRGTTILKQMLSDKKEFKEAIQNSKTNGEVIIKMYKLRQKRISRKTV